MTRHRTRIASWTDKRAAPTFVHNCNSSKLRSFYCLERQVVNLKRLVVYTNARLVLSDSMKCYPMLPVPIIESLDIHDGSLALLFKEFLNIAAVYIIRLETDARNQQYRKCTLTVILYRPRIKKTSII